MLKKIIIFGNSGSGKSTLAKKLAEQNQLAHLDLDTLAWQVGTPVQRKPLAESSLQIKSFITQHPSWVIEGCYSDLLEIALTDASELVFLNLSIEQCINNAKHRPWEPHKYHSKAAQDQNLAMLIDWISQYPRLDDEFSLAAHQKLFDQFTGKKIKHSSQ